MEKPSVNVSKSLSVIRANATQTALLNKAFALSETISTRALQELSNETKLPSKWINNWFTRQRKKFRNLQSKLNEDSTVQASSPSTRLSSSEILDVKLETGDPVLSELTSHAGVASTSYRRATAASYPAILDLPSANSGSRKRGQRGRPKINTKPPQSLNLRSNQKSTATPMNLTKGSADSTLPFDTSGDLRYTPSPSPTDDSQPGRYSGSENHSAVMPPSSKESASIPVAYNQLLAMVAPPKRSAMTTTNNTQESNPQGYRSALSTHQSESIYAPACISGYSSVHETPHLAEISRRKNSERMSSYQQQGPVLRAHFQNNDSSSNHSQNFDIESASPSKLGSALCDIPSYADSIAPPRIPETPMPVHEPRFSGATGYHSMNTPALQPAFDWENSTYSASFSNPSPMLPIPQGGEQGFQYSDRVPYSHAPSVQNFDHSNQLNFEQQTSDSHQYPFEYSQNIEVLPDSHFVDSYQQILDPSLAPLKYLTGILADFKDEQGTYTKLMTFEERHNVKNTLFSDDSLNNDPFLTAMALSLMSRLGLYGDY